MFISADGRERELNAYDDKFNLTFSLKPFTNLQLDSAIIKFTTNVCCFSATSLTAADKKQNVEQHSSNLTARFTFFPFKCVCKCPEVFTANSSCALCRKGLERTQSKVLERRSFCQMTLWVTQSYQHKFSLTTECNAKTWIELWTVSNYHYSCLPCTKDSKKDDLWTSWSTVSSLQNNFILVIRHHPNEKWSGEKNEAPFNQVGGKFATSFLIYFIDSIEAEILLFLLCSWVPMQTWIYFNL